MAGFSTYADILAELAAGKLDVRAFCKASPGTSQGANVWHSFWQGAGDPPSGATPATTPGTQYDDDAGALFFADESSDQKHLLSMGFSGSAAFAVMLYDRLVAVSGISLASTGSKTVNSAALPRYSGAAAANVQAWLEITTATTGTAPVVNLDSYTNDAGTTGRSGGSFTFPAAATVAHAMLGPLPIAAGDKGIRSVEAGLNVATAGSAGVCNLVLLRPLHYVYIPAPATWNERDTVLQLASLPRLFDGASLAAMILPSFGGSFNFAGQVQVARG